MAYRRLKEGTDDEVAAAGHMVSGQENQKASSGSGTLWAEAVLAYTIHKTLLLPFRVMGTGAVTPSFVVSGGNGGRQSQLRPAPD